MVVVGTHNGPFHCDDVMAVALISMFLGKPQVHRTRDAATLAGCELVVDVGGEFDPARGRFDHHQFRSASDRVKSRWLTGVSLSSAGMVLEHLADRGAIPTDVAACLYRDLVAAVDVTDNGDDPLPAEGMPEGMNPPFGSSESEYLASFEDAVAFAMEVVRPHLRAAEGEAKALAFLREQIALQGDGEILVFDKLERGMLVSFSPTWAQEPNSSFIHPRSEDGC